MPEFIPTLTYTKGIQNIKGGALYAADLSAGERQPWHCDPTFNSPCVDASGNPLPGSPIPSAVRRGGISAESRISIRFCRPMTLPAAAASTTTSAMRM